MISYCWFHSSHIKNNIFILQPDIQEELGDELIKSLAKKIEEYPVDETWFDEVQGGLYKALLKVIVNLKICIL